MKALSSMTIFLCSSSRRFFSRTIPPLLFNSESETLVGISHFSTSSPESPTFSSYHSSSRRNSEDVRNVKVSVWWDFENCSVPCNVNVFKVTQCITAAIRTNGIKGPIQITAFGDVLQLSRFNQEALSSTGINLTHIPHGGKNSADRSLLVDLMYWVSQNPPPAHLFLISGDRDFASVLHRLRMNNYNILLASTDNAPAVLCSAASIMWQWTALVKGESLGGKHFNQPPDGPFASWYGQFRVPLEDPFAVSNQTSCLQSKEAFDSNSEAQLRPVPKEVMNVIRTILNSYPKGLSITELRAELGKSNVTVEKDLYGHKKFSRFLLAMPHLLRLQSMKDGQFVVHGVGPKSRETCVPTPDTATGASLSTKDSVPVIASKQNGGQNTSIHATESRTPPDKQEEPQQVQESPSLVEGAKESEINLGQLPPIKLKRPIPEVGIFKTIWRRWFRGNDVHQEKIVHTINECSSRQVSTTVNGNVNSVQSTAQSSDPGRLPSSSLSTNEVIPDAGIAQTSAANADKFSKHRGIFNQIVRWCKSWRSDKNSDNLNTEFSKSDKEISSHSETCEIFTESLWNDILAFLETPKGSLTISQSKTRHEMVQNLQRLGPSRLQTLSERHILHLVDLLVSEKKWVVECPSEASPFRFVGPAISSSSSKPFDSEESTKQKKAFTESDSNLQGRGRHVGGSSLPVKKRVPPKSRSQILAECQKLVNEILKEYPGGFNISSFKKMFLDRYGYHLEVQQLGYPKVATLLQIMPGVKVESNYIFPSGDQSKGFHSENASDLSRKEDDSDSQWEELGPIATMNTKKDDDRVQNDFETLSDNELSDSEQESPPTAKRRTEESSLLQILDSWYSNKCSDVNTVHSNDNMKPPLPGEGDRNDAALVSIQQKQNPSKRYSFVADEPRDDKDVLIDGILGGLKKSGDGSLESKIEG